MVTKTLAPLRHDWPPQVQMLRCGVCRPGFARECARTFYRENRFACNIEELSRYLGEDLFGLGIQALMVAMSARTEMQRLKDLLVSTRFSDENLASVAICFWTDWKGKTKWNTGVDVEARLCRLGKCLRPEAGGKCLVPCRVLLWTSHRILFCKFHTTLRR